ncbi:NAD(P)-dependent oxidoreductase [Paraburkholderia sp. Tr-20389]|uniref:NAD-dependent epimerase/dehydratase family protein n=1 Tax=Paraburkholderia sp. Tr-20389 TaxID=2703903 RepID=UPI0019813889|nr:NAD(P)-dependent oxidoreductase [Paraburkholderia sp. Tr-20389]MBN3754789.1 NAD(P)-dependent oxidoreductase [Paraburkholderia sp. Tr-20389]
MRTGKILVTGAGGLIGSSVARSLQERGNEVIAIDRVGGQIGDVLIQQCDLNDIHHLHAVVGPGLAGVVHCGAFSGPMVARDNPYAMVQVNIVGTANVLELARIYKAQRLVFCSSTSAYGHTASSGPVSEDTVMRPESLYGASKVASEQIVSAYARQYGVDGLSLRLSWVYGPRRTTDCVIRTMLTDAMAGRPTRIGFGADFHRQFIFVHDASNAVLKALDAHTLPRTTYNITGGSRVTLLEVASIVKKIYPTADIDLAPGPDPVDEFQEAFDIRAAARDLEFVPRYRLEDGIREYAGWLEETMRKEG